MSFHWPEDTKFAFGEKALCAKHDYNNLDLFDDDGLARLLDRFPRQSLDIWAFGSTREGETPALRGRAPKMSGREILDAVKQGQIWLNLRRANLELNDFQPIANEIFDGLEEVSEQRIRKREMGLIISSPNVHVHYHLDIPMVTLVQLRGRKRIWIYPTEAEFAPPEYIEDIVHMSREEDIPYRRAFDHQARVFELTPGMALAWPQLAPHRVQNANCINVSLSCEFMTLQSQINANAIYTNAFLRKKFGLAPKAQNGMTPLSVGKAGFAALHKVCMRRGPRLSPTPVSFELDMRSETCMRLLYA